MAFKLCRKLCRRQARLLLSSYVGDKLGFCFVSIATSATSVRACLPLCLRHSSQELASVALLCKSCRRSSAMLVGDKRSFSSAMLVGDKRSFSPKWRLVGDKLHFCILPTSELNSLESFRQSVVGSSLVKAMLVCDEQPKEPTRALVCDKQPTLMLNQCAPQTSCRSSQKSIEKHCSNAHLQFERKYWHQRVAKFQA